MTLSKRGEGPRTGLSWVFSSCHPPLREQQLLDSGAMLPGSHELISVQEPLSCVPACPQEGQGEAGGAFARLDQAWAVSFLHL